MSDDQVRTSVGCRSQLEAGGTAELDRLLLVSYAYVSKVIPRSLLGQLLPCRLPC